MEIEIKIEELRKKKIFVATPMYGGMCCGMYTKSSCDLATIATQYGMDIRFFYLFNESLITRARNYLVDEFLRSPYTHLMFIDSDIHFNPNDVLTLAALDKEIIGAPYPKKCIAWEKVRNAVDAGLADEKPDELEKYTGDFVFNPTAGTSEIKLTEPVEVLEIGTGSGYQAAVLGKLCEHVYTIEIVDELAKESSVRLKKLGFDNVTVRSGDGYKGWTEEAPFDRIMVTASPEEIPDILVEQLAEGGIMVLPVGKQFGIQYLWVLTKEGSGSIKKEKILPVRFVPMVTK